MNNILLIIGFFVAWKIFWYFAYVMSVKLDNYKYCTKMTWSMIKDLYPINPKKWTYDRSSYRTDEIREEEKVMRNLRYKGLPILLSFIDYQKLKFFANKYGGGTRNAEILQIILEDVQKDIEIKKQESEKQIEKAEQMMKEVCSYGSHN